MNMKGGSLSRRRFLRSAALTAGAIILPSTASLAAEIRSVGNCRSTTPHRFLEIVLGGGWDSLLATDPIIGSKQTSRTYQEEYRQFTTVSVPGKSNLKVGHGLAAAVPAFTTLPTSFVNGMLVEVTAHELAFNYLLSGRLSLSRTRTYPSAAALAGIAGDCFPAHVVLGGSIPLGDSDHQFPPLQTSSLATIVQMLSGPRSGESPLPEISVKQTQVAIQKLNEIYLKRLGIKAQRFLSPWIESEIKLSELYNQRYDRQFYISEEMMTRYGIENRFEQDSNLPAALFVLRSGLSPFVTVVLDGYDTHGNHLNEHLPRMQRFAKQLSSLVEDLSLSPDPANPSRMLSETTTIMVTSEFTRTPRFNVADGTDHWQSASAILMGKGVSDNTVVGATDADAYPLGWENATPVPLDRYKNALRPEHVVATLLTILGLDTETIDGISKVRIDELRS